MYDKLCQTQKCKMCDICDICLEFSSAITKAKYLIKSSLIIANLYDSIRIN